MKKSFFFPETNTRSRVRSAEVSPRLRSEPQQRQQRDTGGSSSSSNSGNGVEEAAAAAFFLVAAAAVATAAAASEAPSFQGRNGGERGEGLIIVGLKA